MDEAHMLRLAAIVSDYLIKQNKNELPKKVREASQQIDAYLEEEHRKLLDAGSFWG